MTGSLREYLEPILELIDEALVAEEVRLADRPLQAALAFAADFVLDVSEGSKNNPIGERWFDGLLYEVTRWYGQHYGDALSSNTEGTARALVVFRGTPFGLTIPLTVVRPGDKPGYEWLHFPETVRDDEDPFGFLDVRIGLDGFRNDSVETLRGAIVSAVSQVRSLNVSLMTAESPTAAGPLVARVLPAISQGVQSAVADSAERHSMAVWEFNLSSELVLKVFLHQAGIVPENIHSIADLYTAAIQSGLPPIDQAIVQAFPAAKLVTRYRYGEEPPPSISYIEALYKNAMALTCHTASHFRRQIRMNNAAVYIRTIGTLAKEA